MGEIDRPVDLVRLLMRLGCSLKAAHGLLQRIAAGSRVCVTLRSATPSDIAIPFEELGVSASTLGPPDVLVADVRRRLSLTQAEFARRFGFELKTIRNWEQGRNRPDQTTSVLLAIIGKRPEFVDEVMMESASRRSGRR